MADSRRTSGEVVISEGIRLTHCCWRQTVLSIVSPISRVALSTAAPEQARSSPEPSDRRGSDAASGGASVRRWYGHHEGAHLAGADLDRQLVVIEDVAVDVGQGDGAQPALVGVARVQTVALDAPSRARRCRW